jgi:hypothetical protein
MNAYNIIIIIEHLSVITLTWHTPGLSFDWMIFTSILLSKICSFMKWTESWAIGKYRCIFTSPGLRIIILVWWRWYRCFM